MIIYGMRHKCKKEGEFWLTEMATPTNLHCDAECSRVECPLDDFEYLNLMSGGTLFAAFELVALRGKSMETFH